MVHTPRVEVRHGLTDASRRKLGEIETRASRKALTDDDKGALAAFRLHAMGEDLERVQRVLAATKTEPKKAAPKPVGPLLTDERGTA
jgi:hypothetical protein